MAVDDGYTKSLLHFDGADASTTFTDEAGHTWTANGNAQIDTAQSKFGGASGLFDGTGDYISAPDSDDWRLDDGDNANKWTIDFWVRFASLSSTMGIIQQWQNGYNRWHLRWENDELIFAARDSDVLIINIKNSWTPSANAWYHVAVVKDGSNGYMMFVDGTQIGSTQTDTSTIPNMASDLFVGTRQNSAGTHAYLDGWLDEFRISKGVARWTSNFTPMDGPYGAQHFQAVVIG